MVCRLLDLNCKEKEYKFNLSVLSEQDWENFAQDIIAVKHGKVNDINLIGMKVVIRDNKAKVKMFYSDSKYHEISFQLDAFKIFSKLVGNEINEIWQNTMFKHYGEEYEEALPNEMVLINTSNQEG